MVIIFVGSWLFVATPFIHAIGIGTTGARFLGDEYGMNSVPTGFLSATGEPYLVELGLGTGMWFYSSFYTGDVGPNSYMTSRIEGLDTNKFYVSYVGTSWIEFVFARYWCH